MVSDLMIMLFVSYPPHLTTLRFVKVGFGQVKHLRCFSSDGDYLVVGIIAVW